ncbi:MAG: hypothetical protein ACRD2G_07685, partial [Terriglobia bacterium]
MILIRSAAGLCLLLWLAFPLRAQITYHPSPLSGREFPLMAWGDAPSDAARLRQMREAGLNIAGFCSLQDLQRVKAAGLSCFVSDSRVRGYDWKRMPPEGTLRKNIAAVARVVRENPAALGFFLYDAPSTESYPGLARTAALLHEAAPGKWPYINLLPNYAGAVRLGTRSYEDYVRDYLRSVHPPFLSYNNYSLLNGRMDDRFYTNMEIIRRLTLPAGIPFW